MNKHIYTKLKDQVKPLIKSSITLVEEQDEEAIMGKMMVLTQKIQNGDILAAIELSLIALAANELEATKN